MSALDRRTDRQHTYRLTCIKAGRLAAALDCQDFEHDDETQWRVQQPKKARPLRARSEMPTPKNLSPKKRKLVAGVVG
ncbi:hypothetical protein, partial [Bradyrhizobium sp. Leo170]|uniref:hypothetical protein n=1 Tax=Bradyrhizobium sp. Leo170 TaxID=1571199 RepID=UPI001A933950